MVTNWLFTRDHFVYAPSQWKATLHCNVVFHWLGAHTNDPIRDHFVYAPSQWKATLHCNVVIHWLGAHTNDPSFISKMGQVIGRACLVTWFCYYLTAKPGNQTGAPSWPDPYAHGLGVPYFSMSLQWYHTERDGVSNHQPHDCLLNCLFKAQIKENIKALCHWPLCGEFTGHRWIPCTKDQ